MSFRSGIAIVLLTAAAGASYYLSRQPPIAPARLRGGDGSALPGYHLNAARMIGTDENGRVTYVIHAEELEEMPGEERLTLSGVRIEYSPPEEDRWIITAARAAAPRDGSQLDLEGDVELRSEPADGRSPLIVATAALRFWPHDSAVESDEAVELTVGDWSLAAVGLRALLNDEKVELESRVHGRFAR